MTSAVRNSLKSVFFDPGDQPNLMCYKIKDPTSLMKIVIHNKDNSKRLPQNLEEGNTMWKGCVVYQIMLIQVLHVRCQMSGLSKDLPMSPRTV